MAKLSVELEYDADSIIRVYWSTDCMYCFSSSLATHLNCQTNRRVYTYCLPGIYVTVAYLF